jgi:transcriptional regulator with XRE-family HTH domain
MPKKAVPTLRELRDGFGRPTPPPPMTQKQVAALVYIDQSSLSKIESGADRPSPRLLFRLSQAYGVSYEFIVLCAAETLRRGSKRT